MVTELNGEEDNLTSNRIIILNVHLSCQYFHLYLNIFMSSKLTWRGNYQHLAYIVKKNHKTFKKKNNKQAKCYYTRRYNINSKHINLFKKTSNVYLLIYLFLKWFSRIIDGHWNFRKIETLLFHQHRYLNHIYFVLSWRKFTILLPALMCDDFDLFLKYNL